MSRPKQYEENRYVGDKRTQRVHDLDHATGPCGIDELMRAETFVGFGPDTLPEARNRGYRLCGHCAAARQAAGVDDAA